MGDGRTYIGVGLFALFLIIDAILYSFESALKNINEKEIDEKSQEGDKRAVLLKKIMDSPSRFGDTFDVIMFVTNLVAGGYILTVVRAYIMKCIEADKTLVSIITAVVMLLILLVFGVMIPKKIGKRNPVKTAKRYCRIIQALITLLYPVCVAVSALSHIIIRIFGINPDEDNDNVTEEEIITMVNEGQEQGVLEASEAEMIANIFELGDKSAGDIMTHRASIEAIDCEMTLDTFIQNHIDGKYSRFPVYEGDIDDIIGTIHIRDALIFYRNIPNRAKKLKNLKTLLREPFFVPETRDIDDLLKDMQTAKIHMGIVVDEYGQTAGIISMEDIIEEIVGNILDEYDEEEEAITHDDNGTYVVDGLTELDDINKLLGTDIESEEYDTLNGYLISKLDRIPDDDEKAVVKSDGLVFKITEVSGNVIRKVEITRDEQAQTDNAQAQE